MVEGSGRAGVVSVGGVVVRIEGRSRGQESRVRERKESEGSRKDVKKCRRKRRRSAGYVRVDYEQQVGA